jgi:hypothetical protein
MDNFSEKSKQKGKRQKEKGQNKAKAAKLTPDLVRIV